MQPLMTQADYARHRGVSRPAVRKMVRTGKISLGPDGRIDAAAADLALDGARERIDTTRAPRAGFGDSATADLTRAKLGTEVYTARLAQLKYEQAIGKVLAADDVRNAAVACSEALLRTIDRLPQGAEEIALQALAAPPGEAASRVRALLKVVVRELRRVAADEFSKLALAAAAVPAEPEQQQQDA